MSSEHFQIAAVIVALGALDDFQVKWLISCDCHAQLCIELHNDLPILGSLNSARKSKSSRCDKSHVQFGPCPTLPSYFFLKGEATANAHIYLKVSQEIVKP